jgi:hypothetical protein
MVPAKIARNRIARIRPRSIPIEPETAPDFSAKFTCEPLVRV